MKTHFLPPFRSRDALAITEEKSGERFQSFCRGSIKRLKNAENKVGTAKRDMEDIISSAKVNVLN
jgi:hypothetical protein